METDDCSNYNCDNNVCTICKFPYGEDKLTPRYHCYQQKVIVTNFDKVKSMSVDELAEWLAKECFRNNNCNYDWNKTRYVEWLKMSVRKEREDN